MNQAIDAESSSPWSPRYESVARVVADMVAVGALLPGDKAPSLRTLSKQQRVSVTTAMAAYRLLESRGVLEARPQSGFYVSNARSTALPAPTVSRPSSRPVDVSVAEEVSHMLLLAADPALMPLGCAIPSPDLLSVSRLDKFLARAARVRGVQYNNYSPANGDPVLRRNIALRAARIGHVVSADDIVVTNGCTEALHLALRAVTEPGDTVAVESPTYFGLLQVLQSLGLKALELPTDPANGIVLDALSSSLENGGVSACLLASSFNNPLGCQTSVENKRAILKLLNRYRVPLIEDDIYGDLYFGADRPVPFSALPEARDVLYCNSFSKTLAPGYRLGWVSSSKWQKKIITHKFGISLCAPSLSQAAMADYLDSGAYDLHLRRMRTALSANVASTRRAIGECFPAGTRISQPTGGFVLWVELPPRVNSAEVFDVALQDKICVAPGTLFAAGKRFRNFIRISCGYPWTSELERSIWRLGQIVTDLATPAD